MITYDPKNLFIGTLTDAAIAVVEDIEVGSVVMVHTIHLHNTGASAEVVTIQHFDGTDAFTNETIDLAIGETKYLDFGNEGRVFNATQELRMSASATGVVVADVAGSERTVT